MSIPNTFRPVCGGKSWRPYVQPIMTSNTTWSNTPSFGCSVKVFNSTSVSAESYHVMDGDLSTAIAIFRVSNLDPYSTEKYILVEFAKPVLVQDIAVYGRFEAVHDTCVLGLNEGAADLLYNGHPRPWLEWVQLNINAAKTYRAIKICPLNPSGSYSRIYELKFNALYK